MFNKLFESWRKNKAQEPEQMKLLLDYESRSGRDNFTEKNVPSISALRVIIEHIPERDYFLYIDQCSGNVSHGALNIWVKNDHCALRLDEHQGHCYPPVGKREQPSSTWIKFMNDYELPKEETISYDEGIGMLYNWLATGDFPRFRRHFH